MWLFAWAWLALINLATAAAFALDKRRARAGAWRVPERRLLQLAVLGGTPAALACSALLRHKTRKQPFVSWLRVIAAAQAAAIAAMLWVGLGR